MRLFRSEEEAPPDGATVGLPTLWELSQRWYGSRLDPDWRPRTRDESQAILGGSGLRGDFWRLP